MTIETRSMIPKLTCVLAALACLAPAAVLAQEDLFTFVDVAVAGDQSVFLEALRAEPTTEAVRVVSIDLARPRTADALNLNVAPDLGIALATTRVDERAPGDYSWYGADPESGDHAVLVVQGEDMVGTVRSGGEMYFVRSLGGGLHAVVDVDETAFPPDHPPEFDTVEAGTFDAAAVDVAAVCDEITVLVAYTPAAKAEVANINALIQLAIDETNQSYANSQVNPRLKLMHVTGVQYTEVDWGTDLGRFRTDGDGFMDNVHPLRNTHAADVAILIRKSGGYCGLASTIMATESTAFAAVARNCTTGYYSFGHEIGHLQGARHNPEADPSTTPFPYGHGYYYDPGHWRTIMSYNCPSNCTRIKYWSNPNVSYGGVAMGTAATHHNARVLNETACTIAGFRPPGISITLSPASLSLDEGESATLTATVTSGGAPLPGVTVQFSSLSSTIATVTPASATTSAQGKAQATVKGENDGDTEIKATVQTASANAPVKVPALSAWGLLILAGLGWLLLRRPARGTEGP